MTYAFLSDLTLQINSISIIYEYKFILFFIIICFISLRYLLVKIFIHNSLIDKYYGQIIFKSLSLHTLVSFIILLSFVIYFYLLPNLDYIISTTFVMASIMIILTHTIIYIEIIKKKPKYSFYLILYICGLKLAPWLWLYRTFY